jgi:hypothetical protein
MAVAGDTGDRRKRELPVGVSIREYRELEDGKRSPTFETWDRICKLFDWPQTFVGSWHA